MRQGVKGKGRCLTYNPNHDLSEKKGVQLIIGQDIGINQHHSGQELGVIQKG